MPQATVAAIITPHDDLTTVLLTRRTSGGAFGDRWCIPGGHIEPYEPARDAVVREVKEETGLDFTPRFFGYFDEIFGEHQVHFVVLVFTGAGHGTPRMEEREVSEIAWVPLDEARALALAFRHNEVLDEYAGTLRP